MDSVYIKKVLEGNTEDFRYFIKKYKDLAFSNPKKKLNIFFSLISSFGSTEYLLPEVLR